MNLGQYVKRLEALDRREVQLTDKFDELVEDDLCEETEEIRRIKRRIEEIQKHRRRLFACMKERSIQREKELDRRRQLRK